MLALRYLGFILAGILLYKYKGKLKWRIFMLSFTFGLTVAVIINYVITEPFIFRLWRTTSLPVALYALSWGMLFLLIPQNLFNGKVGNVCAKFGQATYTIFLTQMIYYFLITNSIIPKEPNVLISILVCCVGGYLWYLVDKRIQLGLNGKIKKQTA